MTRWFLEDLHDGFALRLRADTVLFERDTGHQRLSVFETALFGRALALDDILQTTEGDEFIYHEMLAHVPLLAHGSARRVLVIGGGDGGAIEEVLKHRGVEHVRMVEIDAEVIAASRRYLPSICGAAFDDARLALTIGDGAAFVKTCAERYDVIIVDSTDPVGPGVALFGADFYAACKRCLAPGGVLATQAGVPFVQAPVLSDTLAGLKRHFADATCYLATIPTYIGGPMAFGWASDDAALARTPAAELGLRLREAAILTRYYTPEVHRAAFALPGYVARRAAGSATAVGGRLLDPL